MITNNFQKSEEKGRLIFRAFVKSNFKNISQYKESTNPYAKWDVAYEQDGVYHIVEIKYRNYPSNKFITWVLEEDKLNSLQEIKKGYYASAKTVVIEYVNMFTDDTILIWDLNTDTLSGSKRRLEQHVKTTAEASEKKEKAVIHLPSKLAKKYSI